MSGPKKATTTKKLKQKETTTMKTKLTKIIMSSLAVLCALVCLAATMALGTSATARPEPGARNCNHTMLHGLYIWTFDGYQNFGGNPVPKALLQGLQFNGNGTVTVPFGTANIGGTIVIDTGGAEGTYTVNEDCTGTLLFGGLGGPSFNMYIGPGAQQLWITQTGGGPGDGAGLGVGTATRLP
jgi:hypothetical protein